MGKEQQTIGLSGAVFTIVGFVIGVSIFILPGQIAATAGPGVIVSYLIAAVAALFSCLVAAQIGMIVPKSGAGFLSVAAFLSPFWGFMLVWLMLGAASLAVALLGYGFADYMAHLLPGFDRQYVAITVILIFGMINLLGATTAVWMQSLMVVFFLGTLTIFSSVGIINIDPENLTPFLPNGWGPVWTSAVPAFFSFAGFMMIIELGGEIKNARTNIPRALFYSFVIVLVFYVSVSLALIGGIPWTQLSGVDAPIALAASILFPPSILVIILWCALIAAATSINGMVLGYSRYMIPLSNTYLIPKFFGRQSKRHHTPIFGVLFMVVLGIVWAVMETTVMDIATGIVVALMGAQVLIGAALLGYKCRQVANGEHVSILQRYGPYLSAIGLIATSLLFMGMGLIGSKQIVMLTVAYSSIGLFVYVLRMRTMSISISQVKQAIAREIDSVRRQF